MATKSMADLLVDVLIEAGVERIYGVSGDSLNGITDSIRRKKRIQWIHVRHEEAAAFAAGAKSRRKGSSKLLQLVRPCHARRISRA
jgi:pyruvate dehydrogenase (quinone)